MHRSEAGAILQKDGSSNGTNALPNPGPFHQSTSAPQLPVHPGVEGGGDVTCGTLDEDGTLESSCDDLGDGSYRLRWRAQAPGERKVFVKVDGLHVLGSPALVNLVKEPPAPPAEASTL